METLYRSGFRVLIVLACLGLLGIGPAFADTRRPKNVQVALRAKWSGTPLLLEAGELLSKEQKDLFWDFIEVWLRTEKDAVGPQTAKDCVKKILECGKPLLSEPLASLLEFSLFLRSASPRLVLYQQLADESLSSFPLGDESYSNNNKAEIGETIKDNESTKSDLMHGDVNLKSPEGKCCWVDTGAHLFFDVSELNLWIDRAVEP